MSLKASFRYPHYRGFSLDKSLFTTPARKSPRNDTLHAAAYLGDKIDVVLHVRNGADVNAVDITGNQPLHYACDSKSPNQCDIVKILLNHGADPECFSISGQTGLHLAAVSKSPSRIGTIQSFLLAGVHADIRDELGRSPLQYLLSSTTKAADETIIKILIDHGANYYECLSSAELDSDPSGILYLMRYLLLLEEQYPHVRPSRLEKICWYQCDIFQIHKELVASYLITIGRLKKQFLSPNFSLFDFLIADAKSIASYATKQPHLLFILRKRICSNKFSSYFSDLRRQFDIFCYYFVKSQIRLINLSHGQVTLDYDCIEKIASFFEDLTDIVNWCVAFNYDTSPGLHKRKKLSFKR